MIIYVFAIQNIFLWYFTSEKIFYINTFRYIISFQIWLYKKFNTFSDIIDLFSENKRWCLSLTFYSLLLWKILYLFDSLFKIIRQKSNYLIIKIGQISFLHDAEKLILAVLKLHLPFQSTSNYILNASPDQDPALHCAVSLIVLIVSLPLNHFWKIPIWHGAYNCVWSHS